MTPFNATETSFLINAATERTYVLAVVRA